jgi:hypothetical protein
MMKELAYIVHDLVSGKRNTRPAHLSQLERTALAELEPLLRLSPMNLFDLLAQIQDSPEWLMK